MAHDDKLGDLNFSVHFETSDNISSLDIGMPNVSMYFLNSSKTTATITPIMNFQIGFSNTWFQKMVKYQDTHEGKEWVC